MIYKFIKTLKVGQQLYLKLFLWPKTLCRTITMLRKNMPARHKDHSKAVQTIQVKGQM